MAVTLEQVEALADELPADDRRRLIQHLIPRLTKSPLSPQPATPVSPEDAAAAWREYRRVGEQLAALPGESSLTEAVSKMRR